MKDQFLKIAEQEVEFLKYQIEKTYQRARKGAKDFGHIDLRGAKLTDFSHIEIPEGINNKEYLKYFMSYFERIPTLYDVYDKREDGCEFSLVFNDYNITNQNLYVKGYEKSVESLEELLEELSIKDDASVYHAG